MFSIAQKQIGWYGIFDYVGNSPPNEDWKARGQMNKKDNVYFYVFGEIVTNAIIMKIILISNCAILIYNACVVKYAACSSIKLNRSLIP